MLGAQTAGAQLTAKVKVRPPSLRHKPLPRLSTAPMAEVGELDLTPSDLLKLQGSWGIGGESSRSSGPYGVSLSGRTGRDDQFATGAPLWVLPLFPSKGVGGRGPGTQLALWSGMRGWAPSCMTLREAWTAGGQLTGKEWLFF